METDSNQNIEYLYGINAITTLLEVNSGHRRIYGVYISDKRKMDRRIKNIWKLAKDKDIKFSVIDHSHFKDLAAGEENTQNVMAEVSLYNPADLDYFLSKELKPGSRLLILDQVTDMGNFGSIIRNCRAFGFAGIIIAKKRSVALSGKVSRISAGALEGVSIFRIPNLVMTVKKLKSAGFWIYGTTLEKDRKVQQLDETDFVFPMALVMGSEDRGISRIVAENCDVLVSINLTGRMQSLNVSVASGIILHHIQEKYQEEKN
jgi:23S rRNA (guanosine2251-2'-O)-methyltransferase